uniref:ATP synthase F0 subunit 8 n=1 Tax=Colossendeis brevirostris TaxID=619823 RepID=A0A9E8ACB9_9CHEL|nr:ATP synthase F0 subunit 8 [Colossendeis brevirostris]UYX57805.1 ATP synthase F0 subunit 8 [Colossendeis brevirostris]
MPQMMPLNWLFIFIFILLIMTIMFINFSFMSKIKAQKLVLKNKINSNFFMLW